MKKLILVTTCLLAISSYGQSFQLGFAAGTMANYPATTPNLRPDQTAYGRNTNVLTGLYARYDTRTRWSGAITASLFNKSFYYSDALKEDPSTNTPTTYGIDILNTYATDCTFYLLDFSVQYNLNSKAAIKTANFKGLKSYIGLCYTIIQARENIHGTSYDVVNNYNENIKRTYNPNYRAIGLSYYAAYSISKRFALSLNICGRVTTEHLNPDAGKIEFNELDPDYYLSAAFGIAYRITK